MPDDRVTQTLLLPELHLVNVSIGTDKDAYFDVEKRSPSEVCPRCAATSSSVYDHRVVHIRDAPLRSRGVILRIRKRRFFCRPCRKPFTEPIPGIRKGGRLTDASATRCSGRASASARSKTSAIPIAARPASSIARSTSNSSGSGACASRPGPRSSASTSTSFVDDTASPNSSRWSSTSRRRG